MKFLVARGIPIMSQRVNEIGGFKAQGREDDAANNWSSIVKQFEAVGASPACDGQVLVTEDILCTFSDCTPKFAKRYLEMGKAV